MYFLLTNLLGFTRILNLKAAPQKKKKKKQRKKKSEIKRGKNKVVEVFLSQRVLMLPLIKKPLEN